MSRAPRPPKPVESFGPQLLAALLEGAKREVVLPLTYRQAVHFMQRIHELRAAMRRTKHPEYTAAAQARFNLSWPDDTPVKKSSRNVTIPVNPNTPCTLKLMPADSEYTAVLQKAGVTVPELKHDPTQSLEPPAESSSIVDNVLADYLK